jgi:serine/threonine protein kinase
MIVADAAPLMLGAVFADRYQIQEEIGRGSFGVVYRAFDRGPLQRLVALKTIKLRSYSDPEEAKLARRRFLDEARVAGGLSHANIATVFEVAECAGNAYMTQELAPGRDLRKLMRESGHVPLRRTLTIARQVCEGLAYAHAQGIVHRDIKPGNIVVDAQDQVKLTDFGIAQPLERDTTTKNLIAGTPGYAAPEQLTGERVDARADVFSVGCLLYEMLVGRPAFEGTTLASVIEKTLHSFPPAPSGVREDLPRALDRIIDHALRKNRDERYSSITVLMQELLNYGQFEQLLDRASAAHEVAAALEASQCLLFFGLHLSSDGGETSATSVDVIGELLAERLESPRGGRSLARLSQDLELQSGRTELLRQLAAVVRNPRVSPREIVRKVARLPFPVIVTTRYDTFLEEEIVRAGRQIRRIVNCRSMPDDAGTESIIVQLFGSVDHEESIVITEDDLWNFFERFHLLSDALKSLLARRTILFAGYDPEDEGFRHLMTEIGRFRPGVSGGCYLAVANISLAGVRWSTAKGLRLIDCDPAAFFPQLEQSLTERRRQASAQPEAAPPPLPGRPYKFLNYFEAEDEGIYFGRRAEVNKLASKIHAYPLNVLYAASGCGKTSLVCAGLIPLLRREGDLPVYVRVYDDPIDEIRRAALDAAGRDDVQPDTKLPQLLATLAANIGKRIVIFIDQLEELFIRHDREARDRFAAAIDAVLTLGKGRVRVVLSLREDFLARLSEFRDRLPTIFHNELRLDRLANEACRAAIAEPAKLFGLEVEPALIDRLLEDLSKEGIDPPQLQMVCDTLFDGVPPGGKRITLDSYVGLGGTRKILTNYLERVLRESAPSARETTRQVLKLLVTAEDTKTVRRLADLARLAATSEADVSRVLTDLSNRRLVREVPHDDGYWYELTHEYLVQEIAHWLSDEEKELTRVRELLEQAVRNRRNLRILMPSSQIALIRKHEDDLTLSKEERQLVRDSEQALQTRRKTVIAAGAAAILVLAVAGVAGRYVYLTTHRFIHPRDNEFVEVQHGRKTAHRFEEVQVFAGSPTPSWIDSLLRFPRFQYETDFELNQIDPARRDVLKGGLLFGRSDNLDGPILEMLQPVERVRFFLTSGRNDEVVKLLPALYRNRAIDGNSLDRLTALAGYSRIFDPGVVQAAIGHAFRPVSPGGATSTDNLLPLLAGFAEWRAVLVPQLSNARNRRRAIEIIGRIGEPPDAALLRHFLGEREGGSEQIGTVTQSLAEVRSVALRALDNLGDCSTLDQVQRLAVDPSIETDIRVTSASYLKRCGGRFDLKGIEAVAEATLRAKVSMSGEFGTMMMVQNLYQTFEASSLPTLRRIFAAWPLSRIKIEALRFVMEPEILPELHAALLSPDTGVRGTAGVALASRGDLTGIPVIGRIAQDSAQSSAARAEVLGAFRFVKGPSIRDLLVRLATTATEVDLRAAAIRGLRWYADDETLAILVDAFKENDRIVRDAALESFAFVPSDRVADWLGRKPSNLAVGPRMYATRALQMHRQNRYSDVYRGLLAHTDVSVDYPALALGVVGLRDAYLNEPLPNAIVALSDPLREIRLAALLALVDHPDRAKTPELLRDAETSAVVSSTARRASWVVAVGGHAEELRGQIRSSLASGDLQKAGALNALLNGSQTGYLAALRFGLSSLRTSATAENPSPFARDGHLFEEVFVAPARARLLTADVEVRRGFNYRGVTQLTTSVVQNPQMREVIRDDPRFGSLRSIYEFRILTGLQEPLTYDGPLKP